MKKNFILILLLAIAPVFVKADPAKKVTLTYKNGKLHIVALHPVKNVSNHYIDLIAVYVDKKKVKEIKLEKQSTPDAEIQDVDIADLKPGTLIEVKTRCNQFGTKTGDLKL